MNPYNDCLTLMRRSPLLGSELPHENIAGAIVLVLQAGGKHWSGDYTGDCRQVVLDDLAEFTGNSLLDKMRSMWRL